MAPTHTGSLLFAGLFAAVIAAGCGTGPEVQPVSDGELTDGEQVARQAGESADALKGDDNPVLYETNEGTYEPAPDSESAGSQEQSEEAPGPDDSDASRPTEDAESTDDGEATSDDPERDDAGDVPSDAPDDSGNSDDSGTDSADPPASENSDDSQQ